MHPFFLPRLHDDFHKLGMHSSSFYAARLYARRKISIAHEQEPTMGLQCLDVRDAIRYALLRRAMGMASFITREIPNIDVALLVQTLKLQAVHAQGILRELEPALPILASIETFEDFFDPSVLTELGILLPSAVLDDLKDCVTIVHAARAVDDSLVTAQLLKLVLADVTPQDAQLPTFADRLRARPPTDETYRLPDHAVIVAHVDVMHAREFDAAPPSLLHKELVRTIEIVQRA